MRVVYEEGKVSCIQVVYQMSSGYNPVFYWYLTEVFFRNLEEISWSKYSEDKPSSEYIEEIHQLLNRIATHKTRITRH